MQKLSPLPDTQVCGRGYICFPGDNGTYGPDAYLEVPLINFEPPGFERTRYVLAWSYYHKDYYSIADAAQAISPKAVPSSESLLQAYMISRQDRVPEASPFARLAEAFRAFAVTYCDKTIALPLVNIALHSSL